MTISYTLSQALTPDEQAYQKTSVKYDKKTLAKSDTIIASGFGACIKVVLGNLEVYCGKSYVGEKQGTRTLYPGIREVKSILFLSEHGSISLDAISWCAKENISVAMINFQGELVQCFTPMNKDDIKFRVLQYRMYSDEQLRGKIALEIVRCKVNEQKRILQLHPELAMQERSLEIFNSSIAWTDLDEVPSRFYNIQWLMTWEARLSAIFFECFESVKLSWDKTSAKSVNSHWLTVGNRNSLISKSPNAKYASNPFQAAYNYALSVAKRQIKQALAMQGFDDELSFLHSISEERRSSLSLDMLEYFRSELFELCLQFFLKERLSKSHFMVTSDGSCRFNPMFLKYFASTVKLSQETIDSTVKAFKEMLLTC